MSFIIKTWKLSCFFLQYHPNGHTIHIMVDNFGPIYRHHRPLLYTIEISSHAMGTSPLPPAYLETKLYSDK